MSFYIYLGVECCRGRVWWLLYVLIAGAEWDYVILSTVRSLPQYEIDPYPSPGWFSEKLGFVADSHQINVAITRARHGLIIVGNCTVATLLTN